MPYKKDKGYLDVFPYSLMHMDQEVSRLADELISSHLSMTDAHSLPPMHASASQRDFEEEYPDVAAGAHSLPSSLHHQCTTFLTWKHSNYSLNWSQDTR